MSLRIGQFHPFDRDDISQMTQVNILEGKKNPLFCAVRDHNQFLQYSQGKAKTYVGVEDCHVQFHFFMNETAHDIIHLFEKKYKTDRVFHKIRQQVKVVVYGFSMGMSQRDISKKFGIGQSRISVIKNLIREVLLDDEKG